MVEAEVEYGSVKPNKTVTNERSSQTFRALVTTGETITLGIGTLVSTLVFKVSDGTAVTHTKALGVITITEGALADEDVVGWALGAAPA